MSSIVLGIETSCDETSAAVVRDGRLLSNVIASQDFHGEYGGVVPELASRAHQRLIVPIVREALERAGCSADQLTAVSAVYGPGLIGSLLVGLSFGKAFAFGLGIPFYGVNHMEGHIVSNLLDELRPGFPFLNLTVSGGHTQLVMVRNIFEYELLGETVDDAAGEAFDKVAKMMGLGYPGGPLIDRLAKEGNPEAVRFPRPALDDPGYDFSFSGLKTSVLYYLRRMKFAPHVASDGEMSGEERQFIADVCASFQAAVVDVLAAKVMRAADKFGMKNIAIAGGVAANSGLRKRLESDARARGVSVFFPRLEFCTDNGAMVAMVGHLMQKAGRESDLELAATPDLVLQSMEGGEDS